MPCESGAGEDRREGFLGGCQATAAERAGCLGFRHDRGAALPLVVGASTAFPPESPLRREPDLDRAPWQVARWVPELGDGGGARRQRALRRDQRSLATFASRAAAAGGPGLPPPVGPGPGASPPHSAGLYGRG